MRQALDSAPEDPLHVRCDARRLPADAAIVDRLARLSLAVRRQGGELTLWRPSAALSELIGFLGLADVLREER
jgi:hypothetical protein